MQYEDDVLLRLGVCRHELPECNSVIALFSFWKMLLGVRVSPNLGEQMPVADPLVRYTVQEHTCVLCGCEARVGCNGFGCNGGVGGVPGGVGQFLVRIGFVPDPRQGKPHFSTRKSERHRIFRIDLEGVPSQYFEELLLFFSRHNRIGRGRLTLLVDRLFSPSSDCRLF